jgi:hypothetical protein
LIKAKVKVGGAVAERAGERTLDRRVRRAGRKG